ncbi:MAG: hypothetical protein P0Y49_13060 [Candidatus Pedobacter colombiensis]|uniref:Uncharacterized protein n=1 Tax=Candidatus Pedobacter colombiensis TaxID=3121371 RepID=A0AAJ5W5N2_9SPHI|nr:hypothetical protein [Pedobacter sp.]WEK17726.1 MAG: hypothetical protein P0Y49_13060 [Pedobacter sp.]
MKLKIPNNLRTEKHPFRQLSVTSFIISILTIVFGLILLLTVKQDLKAGFINLVVEKLSAGLAFLIVGGISFWRGYQHERSFDLDETYSPAQNKRVNNLLGQRNKGQNGASALSDILHSHSFSLVDIEKSDIKWWEVLFFRLISGKKNSKIVDHLPYPVTQFIKNQSKSISLLASFLVILFFFLFLAYLEIFPINMTWINLFILVGLLSLCRPSRIESLVERSQKNDIRYKIVLFVIFFILTIFFFKPYTGQINFALFAFILAVGAIMIFTSLVAFKLIERAFGKREVVTVNVSTLGRTNHRTYTQPGNLLQQFENTVAKLTGWQTKQATAYAKDALAGDENRKGDFNFEYVYETEPALFSSTYDEETDQLIKKVWGIGTILICLGIILIFCSVMTTPGIDIDLVKNQPTAALITYSPNVLLCLFLVLLGIAVNSFGRKLVYEIYMFFNTEIFFQSNVILFNCTGNYDEFEQHGGGLKRKDTSTDFTLDIKVCNVISSVFIYPSLKADALARRERFIVKTAKNDALLSQLLHDYADNLSTYMLPGDINVMKEQITDFQRSRNIE